MKTILLILALSGSLSAEVGVSLYTNGISKGAADARYVLRNPYYDGSQSVTVASATITGNLEVTGLIGQGRVPTTGIQFWGNNPTDSYTMRLQRGNSTDGYAEIQMGGISGTTFTPGNRILATGTGISLQTDPSPADTSANYTTRLLIANGGAVSVTDDEFSVGTSTLVVTGGKVGVGDSTPDYPLDVEGTSAGGTIATSVTNLGVTANSYASLLLGDGTLNYAAVSANTNSGRMQLGNPTNSDIWLYTNGVANTRMAITSAGNVGIGTSSPTTIMSFGGNAEQVLTVNTTDGADTMSLSIGGAGAAAPTRGAYVGLYGNERATVGGNAYLSAGDTATAGHIIFNTGNDVEKMRISRGGNVGIGSVAPVSKLTVSSGTITVDGTSPGISVGVSTFVVTEGKVGVGTASPETRFSMGAISSHTAVSSYGLSDQGSFNFYNVNATGYDGTDYPRFLDIVSAGSATRHSYIRFLTNAVGGAVTERMRITPAGNVGIATTAPSALLTVQSNSASPTNYLLKVSSANSGTFFYVRNNSHVGFGGPVPTFGTCANAAFATYSNDNAGKITFSGANSTCAVVWAVARTETPVCVCSGATSAGEGCQITAESTSGFTLAPLTGSWDNGDAINYICFGMKP